MENQRLERQKKREEKIKNFNSNESGLRDDGMFGLPFGVSESELVLIPVPWEVTVSYLKGTADGPKAILEASSQIDLYDPLYPQGWQEGIAMEEIPGEIVAKNTAVRHEAEEYLKQYAAGNVDKDLIQKINDECASLHDYVEKKTASFLDNGQFVGVVGGDHSVALGTLKALSRKYESFGILHIDAHMDLRNAYEGFQYSHASICYNALQLPNVRRIVQVGIRDFCEAENSLVEASQGRVKIFTDYDVKKRAFGGTVWQNECRKIVSELPDHVYISFDIDGLDPSLCPNTGTPVPGGLNISEVTLLFETIVASGKKIIGFDLSEVSPGSGGQWDGNVGARVLYKLCLLALLSKNS